MKPNNFSVIAMASVLAVLAVSSFAQNTPRRNRVPNTQRSAYGNNAAQGTVDTTKKAATPQSAYGSNATAPAPTAAFDSTKLRIVDVKSTGGGLIDTVKPSLRNDAAIELNLIKERTPLDYTNIREDDAVYRVRVWREIDIREKINLPFRYAADEDNGGQRFIAILLGAIKSGQVTAFNGEDDRFTTPITFDDAMNALGGGVTLSKHIDTLTGEADYMIRQPRKMDPDSIYKFRLKEEWIFDKETSKMYVRILGIAPVVNQMRSDGVVIPDSWHTAWWVYYPDMRPVLAKYDVYNPKNFGAHMTWEELFEERMFSSYIIKSTLDNPYDIYLAQKYPNSTLFRLLEGDKIKNQIFDYEQGLWSY